MTDNNKKFLESSIQIEDLSKQIKELMDKYNAVPGENTIVVFITCLDDQCTTIIEYIKRELRNYYIAPKDDVNRVIHVEKFYGMRLFGGFFLPGIKTYESLIPAAHHIPDKANGKLLILNFSHIGYDAESGKFGTFVRYGHDKPSSSCGAICGLYDKIKSSSAFPNDMDLRWLGEFLLEVKYKHDVQPLENGVDILDLTVKAYKEQIPWVKEQLSELAKVDDIEVLFIGGIEIDISKGPNNFIHDKIALIEKFHVAKDGTIEDFPTS